MTIIIILHLTFDTTSTCQKKWSNQPPTFNTIASMHVQQKEYNLLTIYYIIGYFFYYQLHHDSVQMSAIYHDNCFC